MLPDAEDVDEDSADDGQDDVGVRVHRVQQTVLRLGNVQVFLAGVFDDARVVVTEVVAHHQHTRQHQHYPLPLRLFERLLAQPERRMDLRRRVQFSVEGGRIRMRKELVG